jgi:serine/threonine protein kinase
VSVKDPNQEPARDPAPTAEQEAAPRQESPSTVSGEGNRTPVPDTITPPPAAATPVERIVPAPGWEPIPGYRLVARLGKGGFGEVWKALGPGDIELAMKFVALDHPAGEAEQLALDKIKNTRHTNLLVLFGFWHIERFLVIAMELADRTLLERLHEVVAQGQPGIPRRELLRYARDTAAVLDYLNKPRHFLGGKRPVGIQHCDIKPQNLLLLGDGVKVGDFGLAQLLGGFLGPGHRGMTPAYAAPECFLGQVSRHSDQYSLAVAYCQLRAGQLPFTAKTAAEFERAHLHNAANLAMLPEAEREPVARALAKQPQARWPNCRSFVKALADSGPGDRGEEKATPPEPPQSPPPPGVRPSGPSHAENAGPAELPPQRQTSGHTGGARAEQLGGLPSSRQRRSVESASSLGELTAEGTRNEATSLAQLSSVQYRQLEESAHQFTQACDRAAGGAASVDLKPYLPPAGDSARRAVLHELIKTHLEICWRRGIRATVADYVVNFPELGSLHSLSADLIYEEYRVRQLYGDTPGLAAYKFLYPSQFDELQQLEKDQPVLTVSSAAMTRAGGPTASGQPRSTASAKPVTSASRTTTGGGDYKFVRRLGYGSFGEVWHAEAPGGIDVAVKVINQPLDHEEAQRELQALERIKKLRHPYLLQTQAFWCKDDRLYIAMDLAEFTLRERLQQCRALSLPGIPPKELHRYISEVAEALDFLHEQQLVHRDIKPENILIVRGYAKVAEFGLVRHMQSKHATSSGTPAYMAPEVWRGKVSVHSDQYSLAVTYAEMRTDRRVFQADTMVDLMLKHLEEEPELACVPLAEQAVLRRSLSKEPERRFGSCQAFAQQLRQCVTTDSAPVVDVSPARPRGDASSEQPTGRTLRPEANTWASVGDIRKPTRCPKAPPEQPPAAASAKASPWTWPAAWASAGLAVIGRWWPLRRAASARGVEQHPHETPDRSPTEAGVSVHVEEPPPSLESGGQPRAIATGGCAGASIGFAPAVSCVLAHDDSIWAVTFSPDGRHVLAGSMDGTASLWDAASGQKRCSFHGHTDGITSLACARSGRHLLTGSLDNTLRWWDVETGRELRRLSGHLNSVLSVALSPDDRLALSGSADGSIRLWDVDTGAELRRFEVFDGHTGWVHAVVFGPDGRSAISGGDDGVLRFWDAATGRERARWINHRGTIRAVAFAPDGRSVLSGGMDGAVWNWDMTGFSDRTLPGHTDWVRAVTFTPDGRRIVSGSDDETVRLWDVSSGELLRTFEGHTWSVLAVAVSPDGRWAVSGSDDATLRFWPLDANASPGGSDP